MNCLKKCNVKQLYLYDIRMYMRIKYKMKLVEEIYITNVMRNCEYKHCPELQI